MAVSFCSSLKQQLAQYKRGVLGVDEDGLWRGNPYPHVLPAAQSKLNILPSLRAEFWSWHSTHGSKIKLHRDFKHLNASQALAFNLFFPTINNLDDGLLLKTLGIEGDVEEFSFEKVLEPKEGTNFDFFIQLRSKARCLFEVKLTEQEFGSCKDDEAHRNKLIDIYLPRVELLVKPECLGPKFFFKHYQLLRNISYLQNSNDRLFLVFPQKNEKLAYAVDWLEEHLLRSVKDQVVVVHLEDLVGRLVGQSSGKAVWKEFSEKYLLAG